MLYICGHKTKVLLPEVVGRKIVRMEAGLVQEAIHGTVGACLHDPTIHETGHGRERLTFRPETPQERQARIQRRLRSVGLNLTPAAAEAMWDTADIETITSGRTVETTPRIRIAHESLLRPDGRAVQLDEIREDWQFGNGVTCNSSVILKDGTQVMASWCVLLTDVGAAIHRDLPAMRALEQCFTG